MPTPAVRDALPELEVALARIVGPDLAGSLVRAAVTRGEWGLDMQLAINDGLTRLDAARRRRALALIDGLMAGGRPGRIA